MYTPDSEGKANAETVVIIKTNILHYEKNYYNWKSHLSNLKKRVELCYVSYSTGPTSGPVARQSFPIYLSFLISDGIEMYRLKIVQSIFGLTFDHSLIIASLNLSIILNSINIKLHISHANWDLYKNIIGSQIYLKIPLRSNYYPGN